MKTITVRFLVIAAVTLWSNGLPAQPVPGRQTVTNTLRVIKPPLLNSNRTVRTSPGQMAPFRTTPRAAKPKATPFVTGSSDMAPLGAIPAAKAPATPTSGNITVKPVATPAVSPAVNRATSQSPRPPSPAIAAPAARRTTGQENVAGQPQPQTAAEALADLNAEVSNEMPVQPQVHTLVPPEMMEAEADVNFPNTPVEQILEIYAEYTGRTMLMGGINKQLTLDVVALDGKLKVPELIQAFDIVLNQNQIAVVPIGEKFLLAVPAAQAIKEGLPFLDIDQTLMPEAPTLMTKMVQLEYAEPKDVVNVIQKFAKVAGGITTVESTRMLIIQDYAINLKRMLELVAKIDVAAPANEQVFEVIPIRYAPVQEVADMLGSFTTKGSAFGSARTTGSGSRGGRSGARSLSSGSNANRNNATANRLNSSFRPQQSRPPTPTRVSTPGTAASQFQQRLRNIVANAAGSDEPEPLLGNASISYYERSNSLLVRGTREEMEKVKTLIAELDQVQPQVLIEAIIMDVSLTDNYQFGINLLQKFTDQGNGARGGGGANNNAGSFFSNFGSTTNSLVNAISSLGGGFSYYGLLGRNWEGVIRAVETDTFATVLSRPQILTTHAEPANLFVGENVPYPASSGLDFSGNLRTTIQSVDVGITLDILPLINPDGLVILEIEQSVDSVREFKPIGDLEAPVTTKRTASSKIAVNTGETIILGGMITNNKSRDDTGTPFLRKIPVLGNLFKRNRKDSNRSELIIMLRPTVLATPELVEESTRLARQNLPGVRRAEMEIEQEDKAWLERIKNDEKKLLEKTANPKKKSRWDLPIDMFDVINK